MIKENKQQAEKQKKKGLPDYISETKMLEKFNDRGATTNGYIMTKIYGTLKEGFYKAKKEKKDSFKIKRIEFSVHKMGFEDTSYGNIFYIHRDYIDDLITLKSRLFKIHAQPEINPSNALKPKETWQEQTDKSKKISGPEL